MSKYLSLCNWHLSIYGDPVALFEGSSYGKSSSGYTSDIRHAYLFDEGIKRCEEEVLINIEDLGLSEEDFTSIRKCKIAHYLMKDYIIRNTDFTYRQVCKFEKERDDEVDRAKQFGYCMMNGGICDGSECDSHVREEYSDGNCCPDHISYWKCQEE